MQNDDENVSMFCQRESVSQTVINLYTGGCKKWDSLFLIGSTREILEIRIEWDSIEWDK